MPFYPFLFLLTAGVYLFLSVRILWLDPKGQLNRVFCIGGILFGLWAFANAGTQMAADATNLWTWHIVSAIGWIAGPAFVLHFDLILSERKRFLSRPLLVILIYLPIAFFYYRVLTGPLIVAGFARIPGGWAEVTTGMTPWSAAYSLYFLGSVAIGLTSVYRWGRRNKVRTKRMQARLVIFVGVVSGILLSVSNLILPDLRIYLTAPLGPIAILPFAVGIGYAASRLKLMALTAETASNDILRTMGDGLILLGWDLRVLITNAVATQVLGLSQERLAGTQITTLFPDFSFVSELTPERLPPGKSLRNIEISYVTPSARPVTLSLSASSVIDQFGDSIGVVLILRDVSDLKLAQEKLNFMATHDPLTGLPNRFLLGDRLAMAIANAQRHGLSLAVILLDLDNFKTVNDTLGHTVGDELLRSFAAKVGRCLRTNDTVARLGGDEFVAVLSDLKAPDEASLVVNRIFAALREPFHIESHELYATASFGISIYPNDGESVEALLRTADTAMYSVKERGKSDFEFFSATMEEQSYQELLSPQSLRKAMAMNQFCLYYQPICDLETGAVVAAEALLRWQHPNRGLLSASSFIPAAESSGLITTIDEWVIRRVCEQKISWLSTDVRDIPISVNISTKCFQREGFVELASKVLSQTGVIPSGLIFELTESAAIKDIEHTRRTLGRLTDLGVRFIIHDFGTSYASLRWLKTVPIYAIKLDKFFVQNLSGDSDSFAIMRAIISMAHTLNFEVIAEGIETKEQAEQLRAMDWRNMPSVRCNQVQGFFYAQPMAPEDFAKRANQPAP